MELETITPSEVTETQKYKHHMPLLCAYTSFESLDMCVYIGILTEIRELVRGRGGILAQGGM